jgi:hypothetical protein
VNDTSGPNEMGAHFLEETRFRDFCDLFVASAEKNGPWELLRETEKKRLAAADEWHLDS